MAMDKSLLLTALRKLFTEDTVSEEADGNVTVQISKDLLVESLRQLKDRTDFAFDFLVDVTAVDRDELFTMIYRLHSLTLSTYIVVKTQIPRQEPVVESVASLWASALFGEREVADMFGIQFAGHPDPRPLLAPEDGFDFFPLRKDFKLVGR